jgi:4-hydroxy-3-polyprenylbenzoate decarboxylase
LGSASGIRIVVAVDEDVDIYSADDVLWAIVTRLDPSTGLQRGGGARGLDSFPIEKRGAVQESVFEGGIGMDATVPLALKWKFKQAKHPIDRVDLEKWFSAEEIASAKAMQHDYARVMAQRGC